MSNTLNMLSEENFVAKMNAQNTLLQQIATSIPKRTPYKYMSVDDYLEITPVADQMYWVVNTNGEHGVYLNGNCVEGKPVAISYDPILDNNTPEQIKAAADAGLAPSIWSVGDKVGIQLNGTIGSLTLNDKYYAFIIGFNHNSAIEGNNTIHFQFGMTSDGTKIAFVDSQYNTNTSGNYFTMNTTNTNSGGWASSRMRTILMPQFKAAMPSEWQSIISTCTKYSDNTGGGSDTTSYVTSTTDDIFLLAEYEVHGTRTYANSAEQNKQEQYDYYKNGNSKICYIYNNTSSTCRWWCRSVYAPNSYNFCYVFANGAADTGYAHLSIGLVSGFKVGGNAA